MQLIGRAFATGLRLWRPKLWVKVAVIPLASVCLALAAWTLVPASISAQTSGDMFSQLDAVPPKPVAVVLGAGVFPNGSLTPVLRGRVDAAIALYNRGKVRKLLMSGDNGSRNYNEPTAMKAYAIAHGVPPVDIVRDYAGFHTFDTCYRAKHVFGIDSAIFVTQAFHLPRTLYLARKMGIDAVGYVAPDNMSSKDLAILTRRERAVTIGAMIDLMINHKPKYTGPVEAGVLVGSNAGR